jgi:hypothetical protein
MALTPEVVPLGPRDRLPTREKSTHVVEISEANFLQRSPMRGASSDSEANYKASSTLQRPQAASPAALGDITSLDLVMLGRETQQTRLAVVWWLLIIVLAVPLACGLFYAAISNATANFASIFQDDRAFPGKVDSMAISTKSPIRSRFGPQSPVDVRMSPMIGSQSPPSLARTVLSLDAIPPPLCANVRSLQSMTSFWVSTQSLQQLLKRTTIDVTGAFHYPVLRAKLSGGLGGTRLEVAAEPSFREILGSVAPMDHPGQLNSNSLLYGPKFALYGPLRRIGPNFTVGHFGRRDNVFTLAPTQTPDGLAFEILANSSGSPHLALAHLVDGRSRYQIDVSAGVDSTLVLICFLAAFISSQKPE